MHMMTASTVSSLHFDLLSCLIVIEILAARLPPVYVTLNPKHQCLDTSVQARTFSLCQRPSSIVLV